MQLEKRKEPVVADPVTDDPKHEDYTSSDFMDYIYPLEEVTMSRQTDFNYVRVPTEQGKMLLEFLKRHIFNGGND